MTTFYIVRHAHGVWQPDEMHRLSENGRAEARRLSTLLADYPLTALFSSPYPRAIETIQPLAARLALPIAIEPDLRERRLTAEPRATAEPGIEPRARLVADFEGAVRWTWKHPDEALEGGEPNASAQRRGIAVIERLAAAAPEGQVVLSTHGSLMALILNALDSDFDFDAWATLTMPDLYRVDFGESGNSRVVRLWCP